MKFSSFFGFGCLLASLFLVACSVNPNPALRSYAADDIDRDGIARAVDRCPGTPAGVPVGRDGCPADSDGDGVFDVLDRCPDSAAGHVVDLQGCNHDSDGDGVFDWRDRCVETEAGVAVDLQGCDFDHVAMGRVESKEGVNGWSERRLVVYFEPERAEILPDFQPLLRVLTEGLAVERIQRIEVVGHADSVGSYFYNLDLSESRAKQVAAFLLSTTPDVAGKMELENWGEQEPVADNTTEMGRQLNRRVEIRVFVSRS